MTFLSFDCFFVIYNNFLSVTGSDEVYALNGTGFNAFSTACTLESIDLRTEVFNLNCIKFTCFYALHTADTAE